MKMRTLSVLLFALSVPLAAVQAAPPANGRAVVYVTRSGKSYHQPGCRFLTWTQAPLTLERAMKRYKPCSYCMVGRGLAPVAAPVASVPPPFGRTPN